VSDPFGEFREDQDAPRGLLRLMPLEPWARPQNARKAAVEVTPQAGSDLQDLIAGLSVPPQVAVISYPRGCRIRRVRVRAVRTPVKDGGRKPVIVSRRALEASRTKNETHADGR
jgi:hypothetical protein